MKKINLTILALFLVLVAYSQTVIEKPKIGFSSAPNVKITKIELTDTSTVLYFHTTAAPGNWISIPEKTYIQTVNGNEKLFIKSADGIPLKKRYTMPESGEVTYKLSFPAISKDEDKFDYGEANDGGSWFIYDIQIKPVQNLSILPQELSGHWFNKVTGDWELSFIDTLVIYKKQLWSYDNVKIKNGEIIVNLKNKGETVTLFIKVIKAGNCMIGESLKELAEYCNRLKEIDKRKPIDDKPYDIPVFKSDSAIYSGYIKGYSPRIGAKTLAISIDDIITGNQNSFLIKITDNGYFSVKLPIYYPHLTFVRSSIYNGSVYLEPGKGLFQIINPETQDNAPLFMGESAKINTDLQQLDKINSFNYFLMQRLILDMTPANYKEYCQNLQKKDLKSLDSIMKTNTISVKAYQIKKLDIVYNYATNIMGYDSNFENAYRTKNKIPRTQRNIPVKVDSLTAGYYDFITNEITNNPLAVLSSNYNYYINRLKYLPILRKISLKGYTTLDIAEELQKTGYKFSDSEKIMIEKMREAELLENSPAKIEFKEKYGERQKAFLIKYSDTLQISMKEKSKVDISLKEYLIKKGIKLTEDEIQLLEAMAEIEKKEGSKTYSGFYKIYQDSITNFHKKHNDFVSSLMTKKFKLARLENLQKILAIQPGFATDIMTAQDACRSIVEEYTPVSDSVIKIIQKEITTPFIAEYIAFCNQQSRTRLEANKYNTGYVVNEVPKMEADLLFDSIMKKYKGKVVYIDFWATWCGPCRSGIERIKPLKEEMADKNVVFVYITNPSSPQKTWSNMIPDIKGEHYRVLNDEWNYLKSKFNISGIPHYVLVNKSGQVINPKLGHLDNETLKRELEKRINE